MRVIRNSIVFCMVSLFSIGLQAQHAILKDQQAAAAFKGAKLVRVDELRNVPVYVEISDEYQISNDNVINLIKEELNFINGIDFQLTQTKTDRLGITHEKYAQLYNGVKYAYISLTIHSKNGKVISFNGNFSPLVPENNEVSISYTEAFQKCLNAVSAEAYYEDENLNKTEELVYLRTNNQKGDFEIKKCYRINVYAKTPLSRALYFVNTENGKIEFVENLIHTGNSNGKAITAYSDTQNIVTDSMASSFRLIDTTRGNGVETYNCQTTKNYASAVDFTDGDNFWDNANTNLDEYATDAHWGTEVMYDYLKTEHNYNSIDDAGFTLKSYIHYDASYVNAFWDGQRMTYGDGDQTTSPLVSLDVVGHEIAHGLTEFSAGLIYAKESGALNESFSDIFGTSLEFKARPNRANWTVGEDIGGSFRSMKDPKLFGDPDTYAGQNWISQDCIPVRGNDHCGVHTNSGVQNRWFYLVAQGDSGVNDMADTFNVSGIGMDKAAQIAFRNLTQYLTPSSGYDDARFYSIISAVDIYGACSQEVEAVTNAWYAVGVGEKYVYGVSAEFSAVFDTNYCESSVNVTFESRGSNVIDFRWDFGNGDTSNLRTPTTNYSAQGTYDVTLIADGGTCGSDTIFRTNYINLDTNMACVYILGGDSSQRVNECEGRIMDSGGIAHNYTINESGVITIDVPNADYIELNFIDLSVEPGSGFSCNKDYIEVYDGDSIISPSLGRFCANNLPSGNLIQSSSNQLTIRFNSDELVASSGFLLTWECKNASQVPLVDFVADVDTSCTGVVSFYSKVSNGTFAYDWDFGDGFISTQKNPIHEYKTDGTYSVKLIAENSVGIDSVLKSSIVTINRPTPPAASMDTFCYGKVGGIKVYSSETVKWYRDTTASSVYTGDSVTFFNMKADTTLYIREVSNEQKYTGGALLNSIGQGDYSDDNDYILFDVFEPIMIHRILFYSDRAGSRTLDIRNNLGEIIHSKEIYVPSSALLVTVELPLQPDTNYRISISSRDNGLFKNTSGANFPYSISNLVTLKSSSDTAGAYPYFYRWQVSRLSCESNFKKVTASVDTSCVITSIAELENKSQFNVYPNPVHQKLLIEGIGAFNSSRVSFEIYSATGQLMYSIRDKQSVKLTQIDMDTYPSGVYYLRITEDGKLTTHKIVKLD